MKNIAVFLLFVFLAQASTSCYGQLDQELSLGLSTTLSLGGVPDAIGISDDEQFALADVWMVTENSLKTAFQQFKSEHSDTLPESVREELKDQLKTTIDKIRETEMGRLESVLNADQLKRLGQIRVQYLMRKTGGVDAVKNELKLSDSQLKAAEKLVTERTGKIHELLKNAKKLNLPVADVRHETAQIKQNFEDRTLQLLTPVQKQKLVQLQGETFEFQFGPKPASADEPDVEPAKRKNLAPTSADSKAGNKK